jgi:hypothetical protein
LRALAARPHWRLADKLQLPWPAVAMALDCRRLVMMDGMVAFAFAVL